MTLENPIRAIREVSHDMTCQRKIRLANGREVSALDIQREYYTKAVEFVERRGGDAVAKRVLDLWGRTLLAIEIDDLELVAREIARQEKRRDFTVDWVHLKLNDQAQRTVLCKDPFRSVDDRVDKLIASM